MPRIFLIADEALTAVAAIASATLYLFGQVAGMPGVEYASFAGLLLLVLYWTQARITYLDKQYEEREKRQEAANNELQKFIHERMHTTLQDLHEVMTRHCEITSEFRSELETMRKIIEANR